MMTEKDFQKIKAHIQSIRNIFHEENKKIDKLIPDEDYMTTCNELNNFLCEAIDNLDKAHQWTNYKLLNWNYDHEEDKDDT